MLVVVVVVVGVVGEEGAVTVVADGGEIFPDTVLNCN